MAHRSPKRRNYPGTWSFPGGHVESGETLEEALVRELKEEIGVQAKSWSFLKQFEDRTSMPNKPVRFQCFLVEDWQGLPTNIGDEHTQICWMTVAEAMELPNLTFPEYIDLFGTLRSAHN